MIRRAALLINLGSPDSTAVTDVKRYLDEFLMDGNVIDLPYISRALLVKGIILNTRPKKSAEAYKSIWWEEGSPLIVLSQRLLKKVQRKTDITVGLAMRYGNPSITHAIHELQKEHPALKELYVIPLYPHYAMSSYGTVKDKVKAICNEHFPGIRPVFKSAFYNEPAYIDILARQIKESYTQDHHILLSYHGIPLRHLKKTDPGSHCLSSEACCEMPSASHDTCYRHQTRTTSRLLMEKLGIPPDGYTISYQSRLGRDEWIKPYTANMLEELPKRGIKKLLVVCPAFVSDCLETLEEIAKEGKEKFLHAGGESFTMVPCLNDDDEWAGLLAQWIDSAKK